MKTKTAKEMVGWLMAKNRRTGVRRIEILGWRRLAAIHDMYKPGSAVRKAINREARRCGYTPSTILTLNA